MSTTPTTALTTEAKPAAKKKAKRKVKSMTAKPATKRKAKAKPKARKNGATPRSPDLVAGSFPSGIKLEEYKDKKGEWRWRLVKRGRIVSAATEGYKRRGGSRSNFKGLQATLKEIALS